MCKYASLLWLTGVDVYNTSGMVVCHLPPIVTHQGNALEAKCFSRTRMNAYKALWLGVIEAQCC